MTSPSREDKINSQQMLAKDWQNTTILDLWHKQVALHYEETYKGIGLAKFPQDLWSYEKLISSSSPKTIIEIGVNNGGFTRWLYDRLLLAATEEPGSTRTLIGLDINIENARHNLSSLSADGSSGVRLELISCDLLDNQSVQKAKQEIIEIIGGQPLLIIEDSGHTYETTNAALSSFSDLLEPGEWFIVEDTCVDIESLRESSEWPRGALKAVNSFLFENSDFERTNFNHAYTITCHPFGFLRKKHTTSHF